MPRSHIPRDGGPRQPESSPAPGGPGTDSAAAPATASRASRPRRPTWAAEPALRRAAWLQAGAALLWLPQAWLLARALGTLVAGGTGVEAVAGEAGLILLLGLVRAVLDIYGGRLAFRSARDRLGRDRARAVAALAGLPPLDPGRPAAGAAAALVTEQAEAVLAYWHRFRPAKLRVVLVGPFILLAVGWVSWLAALLLLLTAPLIFLFMALIGWRAKAASEARLAEVADMHGLLLDRLRGLPTIRALGAVEAAALRLRSLSDTVRRRTMAVLRIAFLSSTVLELFSALGVAMVAVYVGFHLLGELHFGTWGGELGLEQGLFILLLAPAWFEPLRELATLWHDRASGEAALAALQKLGDASAAGSAAAAPADEATPAAPAGAAGQPPALEVRALRFAHPGGVGSVFDGFDLAVAPGERVALLGPSGSGKSTLLALIAGLLRPEAGEIRIDGLPMTPASAPALRHHIAWVGHRPHFRAVSLHANAAFGRSGTLADAALARLLPGVDPARRVGEGGVGLSGGEALRLALARAVADPDAGLILADEPTAHLDAGTADDVADALLAAAEGRTLLVATHDPRLAARLDRIVRIVP